MTSGLRILIFNWHEAYLSMLAGVGHEWVIADWHRPWNASFRPVPANARLCSREDEAAALAADRRVDVIVCQTGQDLLWLGDRSTPPMIYLAHNALANDVAGRDPALAATLRAHVTDALARRNGRFATISEMKWQSWGIEGDVIPPGVDPSATGGYTGEVACALTVANLLRERGHMLGYRELAAGLHGLPWRVVGTNPALGTAEATSWEALRAEYRSHRLYAHATLWPWEDGYNLALLEAMATGMPIVAWANPTSPITEGIDGFVAEDAEMFGRWCRRLLDDPSLARRLGTAARRTVLDRFPFDAFRDRWISLLDEAADPPSSGIPAGITVSQPAMRTPAPARPRRRVLIASAWTPISTAMYYERAFRASHEVITWGPHMQEATLGQWKAVTEQHALKSAGGAEEKIRLLRGLSRPADIPAAEGQPSVVDALARLPRGWTPDLFVWVDGGPSFLPADLGRLDCPTVALVGDSHTQMDWRLAYARCFTHVLCTFNRQHVPLFRAGGCARVDWLPAACDPDIHRAFDVTPAFDVAFVGQTLRQWHPDRVRLLERLIAAGLDVHVSSKILEEMALAFSRGRIVFNRSLAGDLNMRVFEALACGRLLLTDRLAPEAGLEELFTDRVHLVTYDEDDLEALARHYLDHPSEREAIARAGREEVLARHTYRHRVTALLDAVAEGERAGAARAVALEPSVPRVSIVIPVWNRAAFTRRCLAALVRTVDPSTTEVIVVDKGTTHETATVLREMPLPVTVIANRENLGFARASNQGARAARGRLLVLLNNDTEVEPGWLDALWEAAQPDDVAIVGARLLYPATRRVQHAGLALDPDGIPDHLWRNVVGDDPRVTAPRDVDMVTGACLAVSREVFLALGGLDEGYVNGVEDVDLCLGARRLGFRVRYEPRAVALHHEGVSEGRFDRASQNLARLAQKWAPVLATLPRLPRAEFGTLPGPLVAWEGSFFLHHSLAGINRAVCLELLDQGVDLTLSSYEADEMDPASVPGGARLAALVDRPARSNPALRIRHRFPPDFTRNPGEKLVVIQPWEYGAAPAEWVRQIREQVDELWVPSEFVRQGFVASGVPAERVSVVPNGFDPGVFNPDVLPAPLPTGKSFRFLYVGGSIGRKGYDLLLRAYTEEFTAAEDVTLVIKDHAYYGHRLDQELAGLRRRPDCPEIIYYFDHMAPAELARLYAAADWLVHPFRGEGFAMPILEAMACARPCIVTDAGPVREFCPQDATILVPARSLRFPEARVDYLETVGLPFLAEPDLGALRMAMRAAFANRGEGRAWGRRAAAHVHSAYTWKHVGARYAERLRALGVAPAQAGGGAEDAVDAAELDAAYELITDGRLPQALAAFAAIVRRAPSCIRALVGAAHCALALDQRLAARAVLAHVLTLDPEHDGARRALAILDAGGEAPTGAPAIPTWR